MKSFLFVLLLSISGYALSETDGSSCSEGTQVLSSDMSIHLNSVKLGSTMYWAVLEFTGETESGEYSWKLAEHGILEGCTDDGNDRVVRLNPDLAININIADYIEEIKQSSELPPLSINLAYEGVDDNGDLNWRLVEYAYLDALEQNMPESEGTPAKGFSITLKEDGEAASEGGFSLDLGGNEELLMGIVTELVASIESLPSEAESASTESSDESNQSDTVKKSGFSITLKDKSDSTKKGGFSLSFKM